MNRSLSPSLRIIGLIVLAAGVYLQAVRYDFVWDDHQFVSGLNAAVTDTPHFFRYAISAVLETDTLTYRPLFLISYALDTLLWGRNPAGFHLTNILLHVLVTLLVFRLATQWAESARVGGFSAAVFAVHPIHSEAVAWISGRADLLVALFVLTALLYAFRLSAAGGILSPIKCAGWTALIGPSFILALLSKETAIILPGLILLIGFTQKTGDWKKILPALFITTLIALAYFVSRASVLIAVDSGSSITGDLAAMVHGSRSWFETLLAGLYVTGDYLRLLFFPISVKALYDLPPLTMTDPLVIQSGIILCAWIIGAGVVSRRSSVGAAAMGWVLISLLPAYALFIYTAVSPMAERLLYLPSVGFSILLGLAFSGRHEKLRRSRAVRMAGAGLTVGLFSIYIVAALHHNKAWMDDLHFWENTVRNNSENSLAHYNLATAHFERQHWSEAVREYERTVMIKPDYPEAYFNIANAYVALGRRDLAIEYYRTAVRYKPEYADVYINLAVTHHELGQLDLSQKALELAVQYNPRSPIAQNNLANVYAVQGQWKEAIEHYEKALALQPDYPEARINLERAYRLRANEEAPRNP
ncbi:MAG: tetratricopeptide repeat protein [Nitrospirae bacterium]|nr:tetratricopeptide repeat protein [Nitrospirota bacterium]